MSEKVTFVVQDGFVQTITEKEVNGITTKTPKNISLEDFGSMIQKFQSSDSEWLPGEYGLQRYVERKKYNVYCYVTPPKRIKVRYGDTNYEILTPILVWFIGTNKSGQLTRSEVYALKGPLFTYKEELFRAPFSNVYGEGNICWGDNGLEFPTKKSIQSIYNRFFGAPFNSDLDENRINDVRDYNNNRMFRAQHLFRHLNHEIKEEKKTDVEILEEYETKILRRQCVTFERAWDTFLDRVN